FPATSTLRSPRPLPQLHDHDVGLLDDPAHHLGGAGHGGAVDDAVVGAPAKVADVLLDHIVVLVKGRHGAHAPDAEAGHLALDNDGAEIRAADVADVGHGDGAARHVGRRQLAGVREALQPHELGRDGHDVEAADVLNDRYDE